MTQKKISFRLAYLPARISQKKDRWEIVYYQTDPATTQRRRHRETWDLNRIRDKRERLKEARRIVNQINEWLPHGYPHSTHKEIEARLATPSLVDAFQTALAIKLKTDKYETEKSYQSIGNVFLMWVGHRGCGQIAVTDFSRRMAIEYLDYVATRRTRQGKPISNRTWNNYKGITGAIFGELVGREYIRENPFKGLAKKRVATKTRRKCTPDERSTIAAWLWKNDYFTFLAVILQYYCLFRGTELRRLRAADFYPDKHLIYLEARKSKTDRERWVTMPPFVHQILNDARFTRIPGHYLVFGLLGKPHATDPCGRGHVWRHLRAAMRALQAAGRLEDLSGISPYSFKDTGITDWLKVIPLPDVMKQAGHTNPSTTMIYYQPDRVSEPFQNLEANIFEANTSAGAGDIAADQPG